jgi:tRNA threonylcarbamoyladenosine modification (KEOPS) complex  Pcc1 subunit
VIDAVISSEIVIKSKNCEQLKKLLDLELKRKEYKRSKAEVIIENNLIVIKIYAKDIIALKATNNMIISILELIFKIYEVEL